jgi:succinylarginine dihydrolase
MISKYCVLALFTLATQLGFASDQVQCKQMDNDVVVIATSGGIVYAVNGTARTIAASQGWKDGKDHFEPANLQSLLKQGLQSCSTSGSTLVPLLLSQLQR